MIPRRQFLQLAAAAAAASGLPAYAQPATPSKTPNEDLMQEHGLVHRVMLIYQRAIGFIESGARFPASRVADAARIVSRVIHGHHEIEEEEILFPQLDRPADLNMLTEVLRGQHAVARQLTARIGLEVADPGKVRQVVVPMREFIDMYGPHGAYEDTIIYPAFRERVGPQRYEELARVFVEHERNLRGTFAGYVREIGAIEDSLGIGLAQLTASPPPPRRSE